MWPSSRRAGPLALLATLALSSVGCIENALLREWQRPFDYEPIPMPELDPPADGAVWRGDSPSGSFLFFDQKARGLGDLVTIVVQENISAEGAAATEATSESVLDASISSDVGFADFVSKVFRNFFKIFGISSPGAFVPPGETVNTIASDKLSEFEGEGSTSRSGRFTAIVTCRVVRVLPGRVFHVRGRRSLLVNHEQQFLTVEGLLRPEDINIHNVAVSTSLAEARLTLDGIGVLDDKQRPAWFARVLDWVYPF